jgi:hypothetical protein
MLGIGNADQSVGEPERTMYALLSDVNIIATDARPTHIPMRYRFQVASGSGKPS